MSENPQANNDVSISEAELAALLEKEGVAENELGPQQPDIKSIRKTVTAAFLPEQNGESHGLLSQEEIDALLEDQEEK